MKIGLAADHRGYELKEQLKHYLEKTYEVIDYGTNDTKRVDYPDYAQKLADGINKKEVDLGIAICGTGIGISIALNKAKNIMCAKISTKEEAILAKEHNHANAIALSGTLDYYKARKMVKAFLKATPNNDKVYLKRIEKIGKIK